MRRSDFDYELPESLIAQAPPPARSAGRLLHLAPGAGPADHGVRDLPALLRPGDLAIFNDTRVVPARLLGAKLSGGRVEVFVERVLDERTARAQIRASKPSRPGTRIEVEGSDAVLEVRGRDEDAFTVARVAGPDWDTLLDAAGHVPLPPYIRRPDAQEDRERYQTVFARERGAVAAPTAGLHFDEALLAALDARGVARTTLTLHVGLGTFRPVREEDLTRHHMHSERFSIPDALPGAVRATRKAGGRVIAVGTTVLRALEASWDGDAPRAGASETDLFITPGYRFRAADLLFTNFHLPQSTLLMLACAFGGTGRVLAAYRHAVAQRYRFFSYGDAMLIEPEAGA